MIEKYSSTHARRSFVVGVFVLGISCITIGAAPSYGIDTNAIAAMKEEAADIQRQLIETERAARATGGSSTSELADRALLIEDLLVKLHEIMDAENRQRELSIERDSSLRELQQALAEASSREERRLLLFQHQALQRAIALDQSIINTATPNTSK